MENRLQKNAFIGHEADAWFDRNKEYLNKYSAKEDKVINLNMPMNPWMWLLLDLYFMY